MGIRTLIATAGTIALVSAAALAQSPTLPVENHYMTYLNTRVTAVDSISLTDQFLGPLSARFHMTFERFSNPAQKTHNGVVYPIINPSVHMDWWNISWKTGVHEIVVTDQFGQANWRVANLRYLLVPSLKNDRPTSTPPAWNHYMCYDVLNGPSYKITVAVVDQFGTTQASIAVPRYFCNPATKTHNGVVYPIIDPSAHLACYRIDNPTHANFVITATDQFGFWQTQTVQTDCLCLPALKDEPVKTQQSTWGRIKALYRN